MLRNAPLRALASFTLRAPSPPSSQAAAVLDALQGLSFGGAKTLALSSVVAAALPAAETRDFTSSPHHRYSRGQPPSKPAPAPCATLYFSNAPLGVSEAELHAVVLATGAPTPTAVKFIGAAEAQAAGKRHISGFIDFETTAAAASGLALAGHAAVAGVPIRLSFAAKASVVPSAARAPQPPQAQAQALPTVSDDPVTADAAADADAAAAATAAALASVTGAE